MKWELYEQLTQEQKEEYNYRFRNKFGLLGFTRELFYSGILIIIAIFGFFAIGFSFMSIIDYTHSEGTLATIGEAMVELVYLIKLWLITLGLTAVGEYIYSLRFLSKRNKWVKSCIQKNKINEESKE